MAANRRQRHFESNLPGSVRQFKIDTHEDSGRKANGMLCSLRATSQGPAGQRPYLVSSSPLQRGPIRPQSLVCQGVMEEIRAHDLIGGCCRQDRDIEHFHDEQKGQGDQEYLETVSKQDSGVMSSFNIDTNNGRLLSQNSIISAISGFYQPAMTHRVTTKHEIPSSSFLRASSGNLDCLKFWTRPEACRDDGLGEFHIIAIPRRHP